MPTDHRVRLYEDEGTAPAAPEVAETDPEQPIESGQDGALALPLECRELQAQSGVLHRKCLIATTE
jgi:hypothetical protein